MLDQWASIAEIVSSIAIVATLIYLSVQTRQNTNALLAVSRQTALQAELDLASDWIEHPEFVAGPYTLEESSRVAWIIKLLRVREFEWHQYQSGILDEASLNSYMAPMPALLEDELGRRTFDWYGGDPGFKAYVSELLRE